MLRNALSLFFLLVGITTHAQLYTLRGRVTNVRLEPLAFASVQIKELSRGTVTKEAGTYAFQLEAGKYTLVISMVGYQTQTLTLALTGDYEQNVILEEGDGKLNEVVVKSRSRDRSEEIIRQVIRQKETILAAPGPYSVQLYIKAVQQDSTAHKGSRKLDTVSKVDPTLRSMQLAEVALQLDYAGGRIHEERVGVKGANRFTNLFYLSATEGEFNFYHNLVQVKGLSTASFVSPLSYSGLLAYRYRMLKTEKRGTETWYTIAVRPRQLSNATVEGEVTISDGDWAVCQLRFVFPRYHLPEYDFFEVQQTFDKIRDTAWLPVRQQFTYVSKAGRLSRSGQTTVLYSDYRLHQSFPKNHFGPEVSATTGEAYAKDSSFWQTVRPEPLSEKELRLVRYRDSLYRVTHTQRYLDSIDRLTNRVTWKKLGISGQTLYNRQKERTWQLPPVVSLYNPLGFGGSRISASVFFAKTYKSRRNLSVYTNLNYGFRNNDLNGTLRFNRMYNPFNRGFYSIYLSRDFSAIFSGDAWINSLKRSNYYLNNSLGAGNGLEIANGLFVYTNWDIAFRRSLQNYKTGTLVDSLFGSILDNNRAIGFASYNAVYGRIRVQYTPKQAYIREPKEKVILGSRWPTFYLQWRKGIPGVFRSTVDFDYLEGGIEQQLNAGLLGTSRYSVKTGSFLNRRDLRLVDYQFQRRGDPILYMNPHVAFQLLDSTFPVFRQYYQGHFVHEFNGFFINKIPFLKQLQLRETGGAGFLIAPERNLRYAEAFAGVERVFKWPFNPLSRFKLGVYVVGSVANRFTNPVRFKVGLTTWDKVRNQWN